MKKITLIISLIGFLSLANATIISFCPLPDDPETDRIDFLTADGLGFYGQIDGVTYQDGTMYGLSVFNQPPAGFEPLLEAGVGASRGRLSMRIAGSNDVLEIKHGTDLLMQGYFTTDLTSYASGDYTLGDVEFHEPGFSPAIDELAALYEQYPENAVSFYFGGDGNSVGMRGQVTSVLEPSSYFGGDGNSVGMREQVTSVPEPTTLGLLGMGLIGAAFFRKRKK